MANELWAKCSKCPEGKEFRIVPNQQRNLKVDQIITGQAHGILLLTCPQGHKLMLDSSDRSRVFVRPQIGTILPTH